MGKYSRGIDRGQCACGECEEFERDMEFPVVYYYYLPLSTTPIDGRKPDDFQPELK